jgi:diguanylate cyclase (GGDEF)-like protein
MRTSFGIKLGAVITLLTVGMTTVSVYYFYSVTSALVRRQVVGRLKDIGHVGTFLFDEKDRENIVKLKAEIDQESQVSISDIQKLKPGDVLNSLTPQKIHYYHSTIEFQRLTQILRKIQYSSEDRVNPLKRYYPQAFLTYPNAVLPYLLITTPESHDHKILKFIASVAPEPEGKKWPGNPIGNLYAPVAPLFSQALKGEVQIAEDYYTDSFYTSITAAIPIKDNRGQTIAVLGIDYLAGSEQDQLRNLKSICISIIISSLILSVILSLFISRYLGYPVKQLQIAAQKVRDQNYEVVVDIKRQDELGLLAEIFNEMIAEISNYSVVLEKKNSQLKDHTQNLEQIVKERTLALSEANQKLQELAKLDGLTDIFNRRYFDEYLQTEWQRAIRAQSWLTLILCDVDHFKLYNDTYGHQAGDECLRKVANTIFQCLNRSGDIVARYGGEEFAIILPNTCLKGALNMAERIRLGVKSLELEHMASQTNSCVTISMGVASTIPQIKQSYTDLIEDADRGLYQSKEKGRDRISIYAGKNEA